MAHEPQPRLGQAALSPAAPGSAPGAPGAPGTAERRAKNADLFDDAAGDAWRLLVYEPVHAGWSFANIGGRRALALLARHARLGPGDAVLEPACGVGDTCCWLAARYGCTVTGLEINPHQLAAARANRARRDAADPRLGLRRRVRFARADLARWRPRRRVRALYVLDSLMYLSHRPQILGRLRDALVPGGTLLLAEVLAGPALDEALRCWLWHEEGVAQLPRPEEQDAMLATAGFAVAARHDWTGQAVACFTAVCRAQVAHRDELLARGLEHYADTPSNRLHLEAFQHRALVYIVTLATRR